MKDRPSYVVAAFNARPLGMPVPPNWFGIAAFALLGAFVHPGLWLIGLGIEGLYLRVMATSPRFRKTVDALAGAARGGTRYEAMLESLDADAQHHQHEVESEAGEIVGLLQRGTAHESQVADVRQIAWLHLKLLSARAALAAVVAAAEREGRTLDEQERRCRDRLASGSADEDLVRSLHQQLEVIRSRHDAHADARRRLELVDAELARLRQQISLVREQVLLATDEESMAQSLDAVAASLNEANRWLKDQRELFAGLENLTEEPPPAELLVAKRAGKRPNVLPSALAKEKH